MHGLLKKVNFYFIFSEKLIFRILRMLFNYSYDNDFHYNWAKSLHSGFYCVYSRADCVSGLLAGLNAFLGLRNVSSEFVVTKTRNDLQWSTMTYNDLQWSTMTYNDLQWSKMTYNDLKWPTMSYYELLRAKMS